MKSRFFPTTYTVCATIVATLAICNVSDCLAADNSYQTRALSPKHRMDLEQNVKQAQTAVAQANSLQQWGVAMEELCKQLLLLEHYDEAMDVALKVANKQGVDPERRAAHHFLVAQINMYKLEASPTAAEMQRNRQLAERAANDVIARQYSPQWGVTEAAQQLLAKLRSPEYIGNVNSGIRQRQTGDAGNGQWRTAERNNRTGRLDVDQNFIKQLGDDPQQYGDAPSLSGGTAQQTATYPANPEVPPNELTGGYPQAITSDKGQTRPVNGMSPSGTSTGIRPADTNANRTQRGDLSGALGNYRPYPSLPSENATLLNRKKVTDPVQASSTPRPIAPLPSQMTTAQRAAAVAGRDPNMQRYGEGKDETTRAYRRPADEESERSRTKRHPFITPATNQAMIFCHLRLPSREDCLSMEKPFNREHQIREFNKLKNARSGKPCVK